MVAILLAAPIIDSGRLKMTVLVLAEPGLLLRRRQGDGVQPVDRFPVGDALAILVEILPVTAVLPARVARLAVAAMAQSAAVLLPLAHRQH